MLQLDTGCAAILCWSLQVETQHLFASNLKLCHLKVFQFQFQRFNVPFTLSWASLVAQMVKNLPAMWETWFNPWLGRSPEERNGYSLQYSCLENSMDTGAAWWTIIHLTQKVRDNWTINTFTLFHFHSLLHPTKMTHYFSYSSSENQSNTPPKCMGTGKYWGANEFLVNTNIPW